MIPDSLMACLIEFRRQRDWEQFHTPRNLSAALCVEAGELLTHFRWARDGEVDSIATERRGEVELEVADIAILLLYFCHDLRFSISDAIEKKLAINEERYPVQKAKGVATKYDSL